MTEKSQRLAFFLTALTALMMVGVVGGILLLRQELRRETPSTIDAPTVEALRALSIRLDQMDAAHREEMASLTEKLQAPPPAPVAEPAEVPVTPAPELVPVEEKLEAMQAQLNEQQQAKDDKAAAEAELLKRFLLLKKRAVSGESYESALAAFEEMAGDRYKEQRAVLREPAVAGIPTPSQLREDFLQLLEQEEVPSEAETPVAASDADIDTLNEKLHGLVTVRRSKPPVQADDDMRLRATTADPEALEALIDELPEEQHAQFDDWREELEQYHAALEALAAIESELLGQ